MMRILRAIAAGWVTLITALAGTYEQDAAWVETRVNELQPTLAEKRFDQIGWAEDIREAERLARQHKRPVFLFTHDGRINTGRC